MKPYMHLRMPIKIDSRWKDKFPVIDETTRLHYGDTGCTLLSDSTRYYFQTALKMPAVFGLLWSWPNSYDINEYHIDNYSQTGGKLDEKDMYKFSMNVLLQGSRGKTEWANMDNCTAIVEDTQIELRDSEEKATGYRGSSTGLFYDREPDWSTSIMPGYPMMMDVQVPHRVNKDKEGPMRWTYSIRFKKPDMSQYTWEEAVEKLKHLELPESKEY
jgi:hypothetical protein